MTLWATVKTEVNTWRNLVRKRMYISSKAEKEIVDNFHKLYYDSHNFGRSFVNTFWLGVPTLKCPLDLWVYQEMFHELKPDVVIETGTAGGGSALFMASLFDLMGNGRILSIDIEPNPKRPVHPRIEYLLGSSTAPEILEKVRKAVSGKKTVLVILDSDHSEKHVREELRLYHGFVTPGSYLVVEDTNVNGHPVFLEHGPGPMEAMQDFLKENKSFAIDDSREKFYMTFNPRGFLKKIR